MHVLFRLTLLVSLTVLIWIALVMGFSALKYSGFMPGDGPELIMFMLVATFIWAVQIVNRLNRRLSSRTAESCSGRTGPA